MTRAEALRGLLAKVEAGNIPDTGTDRFSAIPRRGGGVYSDPNWHDAKEAYWRSSLDAALALHEAVLPGWWVTMWGREGDGKTCGVILARVVDGRPRNQASASCGIFARAWLIALLRALITQEVGDE